MKVIALCTNVPELDQGGYRDPKICKKYRGAEWIPYFIEYAAQANQTVFSGSEAIRHGVATETQVICEEENKIAQELIQQGAEPSLLYCMESPLFTPFFYDHLPELKGRFKKQLLFEGGTDHLYFPSFDQNFVPPEKEIRLNKTVAICSNKHYQMLPREFESSPSFQRAMAHQLHDQRYNQFIQGKKEGRVDLYGRGWPEGFAFPVEDKIGVLKLYQKAFCYENVSLPGYITEKLLDCFVAGVEPIYLGAPDLFTWVSENALESPENGYEFLRSELGQRYSFQGFARNLLSLLS